MAAVSRYLPFAPSTTALQAATYLLGISLFSISFLVFLNSSISFVITDLIGQKDGVGDVVGTLGFVDEIVALVACPIWGLVSDRLGVRWVAVIGYLVLGAALFLFVQAKNVYPQLLLARIFFAVGATAAATMVTAILPSLTDESEPYPTECPVPRKAHNPRLSIATSLESDMTITPERYRRLVEGESSRARSSPLSRCNDERTLGRPSALAGYVGLFTGCGALVALSLFLPLPARFGEIDGVTPARAITDSFYVVGAVAFAVAIFVSIGLRGIRGEEGKGWRVLFARVREGGSEMQRLEDEERNRKARVLPYLQLFRDSIRLGFTDSNIALGYLGGFVARASTVAISLFIPLYVNTYFIDNGFCHGSPHDPSPELKKGCRSAYVLAAILTGVAQLLGLLCAPVFGYFSSRSAGLPVNVPIVVSTVFGVIGYLIFPRLHSPEIKDIDGRGGNPIVFLVVSLIGISQIGAIVCSLGLLGRGVLSADLPKRGSGTEAMNGDECDPNNETTALLLPEGHAEIVDYSSRVRLKGSIAGVYSWFGGAAILLLTKLGGYLFDSVSMGAPFYMMALFNLILLLASLSVDIGHVAKKRS